MAQTLPQITAALTAAYPTLSVTANGVSATLSQSAYDARIAEMAAAELANQQAADAAAGKKAVRRQARLALATLATNITLLTGAPTQAQVKGCVLDNAKILQGLIQVLIDLQLVEATD